MSQVELGALSRVAKQQRERGRHAERDRGEESQLLRKMQGRIQELKVALGGRVKQLEADLARSEAARVKQEEEGKEVRGYHTRYLRILFRSDKNWRSTR